MPNFAENPDCCLYFISCKVLTERRQRKKCEFRMTQFRMKYSDYGFLRFLKSLNSNLASEIKKNVIQDGVFNDRNHSSQTIEFYVDRNIFQTFDPRLWIETLQISRVKFEFNKPEKHAIPHSFNFSGFVFLLKIPHLCK